MAAWTAMVRFTEPRWSSGLYRLYETAGVVKECPAGPWFLRRASCFSSSLEKIGYHIKEVVEEVLNLVSGPISVITLADSLYLKENAIVGFSKIDFVIDQFIASFSSLSEI